MKKAVSLLLLWMGMAMGHGGHVELSATALKKVSGGYVLVATIDYHEKDLVTLNSAVIGGLPGLLQMKGSKSYVPIKKLPINMGVTRLGSSTSYRVFFKTLPKVKKLYLTLLLSGNVLGQEIKLIP